VSQENVEIVREAIEAFNRRDIDRAFRDVGPDVELDWTRSRGTEAGVYHGREASLAFWSAWLDLFDQISFEPDEFIDCGADVVVPNLMHLRGRDGVPVEARSAVVATVRGGCIVVWRLFQDRDEALKAVGLEE
jgi:ketosteroid isomerase-like protein